MRDQRKGIIHGTCELCGGHDRDLRILMIGGFIGWACEICRKQLRDSQERRFMPACEHTEPGE